MGNDKLTYSMNIEKLSPGIFVRMRRAFNKFLKIPFYILVGFVVLAIFVYALDGSDAAWLHALRSAIKSYAFESAKETGQFLGAVSSGLITATSITISMLLMTLQQSASTLSSQVIDQFLHRRYNQVYFGFFVGVTFFSFLLQAATTSSFNPVVGAALTVVFVGAAVFTIVLLLYSTVYQMRTETIIGEIHYQTLKARRRQQSFLLRTRRESQIEAPVEYPVRAEKYGFVTHIDLDLMREAVAHAAGDVEIVLQFAFGTFVAYEDVVAIVKAQTEEIAARVGESVLQALTLERQRDLFFDAAYGLEQFEMVAWTSISTSKSNPEPGLLVIRNLRDVMSRWMAVEETPSLDEGDVAPPVPVVYEDDVLLKLLGVFESLAVASSESMQHQNYTEVVHTLAKLYPRMPEALQGRAEDLIRRILSAMGDHVLTSKLSEDLELLVWTLREAGAGETAQAVATAHAELRQSVGELNSRSTRVKAGGG